MPSTLVLVAAVALLVAGVVGSLVPVVPGAALSLAGVLVYWAGSGFSSPGPILLVVFVTLSLGAALVDLLDGAIAAGAGGASRTTVILAVVVSLVLALLTGPLAIFLGIPLAVFLLEWHRGQDVRTAGRTAVVTAVGMLASTVVQVVLTGAVLVGFGLFVWL